MEKVAFLIGAYQNPDYLQYLVNSLDSINTNIYIHINKKNAVLFDDFINENKQKKNVFIFSEFKINWGGTTLLKSQLFLIRKALEDVDNVYFHFVTGQDILTKPLQDLIDFSFNNSNNNYLDCRDYTDPKWDSRYRCYNFFDSINYKACLFNKILLTLISSFQYYLKIYRKKWNFETLKIGSCWWSLNRDAVFLISKWFNNEENQKIIKYTLAPDEIIYQCILYNSELRESIKGHNLCFLKWDGGGSPKVLKEEDYDDIRESGLFFARKILPSISKNLIKSIDNAKKI